MRMTLQMGSGIPGVSKYFSQWLMAAELGSQSSASSLCCWAGGQQPSNIRWKCKTHLVHVWNFWLIRMVGSPAAPHPPACAQAAWIWGKAGCCEANRSNRRSTCTGLMPTDVHGSTAGAHQAPPVVFPCRTGTQRLKGTYRKDGEELVIRGNSDRIESWIERGLI